MTPEEIKKMADNSAYKTIDDWKQNKEIGLRKLISDACVDAINSLTERFYLIEKGKVEEEYEAAKWHKETAEGMNIQYGKGMAKGQLITLENLFGPDIRKEEEE